MTNFPILHIGDEIKKKFDQSGLTQKEFGNRIGMAQQNVARIFASESIDTKRLVAVSNALNYNFFELYTSNSNNIETHGDMSPVSRDGNISQVIGDAVLVERVKALEKLVAEKERLIQVLMAK